jgi:hypothetical protein
MSTLAAIFYTGKKIVMLITMVVGYAVYKKSSS